MDSVNEGILKLMLNTTNMTSSNMTSSMTSSNEEGQEQNDILQTSMTLMRSLLVDAQVSDVIIVFCLLCLIQILEEGGINLANSTFCKIRAFFTHQFYNDRPTSKVL